MWQNVTGIESGASICLLQKFRRFVKKTGSEIIKLKFIILLLLFFSANNIASQNIEDPEQMLSMLRKILSAPKVAADIESYVRSGCTWKSESIWSGTGEQISEGVWRYGGGITFYFVTHSGDEIKLAYKYNILLREKKSTIEEIRGEQSRNSIPECSQ